MTTEDRINFLRDEVKRHRAEAKKVKVMSYLAIGGGGVLYALDFHTPAMGLLALGFLGIVLWGIEEMQESIAKVRLDQAAYVEGPLADGLIEFRVLQMRLRDLSEGERQNRD